MFTHDGFSDVITTLVLFLPNTIYIAFRKPLFDNYWVTVDGVDSINTLFSPVSARPYGSEEFLRQIRSCKESGSQGHFISRCFGVT